VDVQLFYGQSIIFSLDLLYEHQNASIFYGHPGLDFIGKHSDPNQPSSERVSVAPSFAYQFPSQVGIMVGSWISLSGRNVEQFIQYIANVFYIF
jgi:hypothetical protein